MAARDLKSPLDTWDIYSVITELDEEPIARIACPKTPSTIRYQRSCPDCKLSHLPKRIVCCVDGTFMGSDGPKGEEQGNASNIFRIWMSVKQGEVRDKDGSKRFQIRKYFKGLGNSLGIVPRLHAGITGSGYEELIFNVYKFCALNCCPSQDEIFLFGYSRGAYIVRAVSALFYHLRTVDPKSDDFEELYKYSLNFYRNSKVEEKRKFHRHEAYHHMSSNTLPPTSIKFVGVFDTVKASDNSGLYDISQTPNVAHVRHALAILEQRKSYSPEKYVDLKKSITEDTPGPLKQTCIESWFMGTHSNLGGALAEDGLSLWPLQFILSEAENCGLVLGFQPIPSLHIQNPLEYVMPGINAFGSEDDSSIDSIIGEKHPRDGILQMTQSIPYRNGLSVNIWDLTDVFTSLPGFSPLVNVEGMTISKSERTITGLYDKECSVDTIIHPSVYYHDDCTPLGLDYISSLKDGGHCIRDYSVNLGVPWNELFWNKPFYAEADLTLVNPRVLVCGSHGSSKSTIINVVADETIAKENSSMESTDHNIMKELRSKKCEFVFHDSQGWDNGSNKPYLAVDRFLENRRNQPLFTEQLHCIWYCIEGFQSRINTIDKEFFKNIDPKGITIILVFTKCDRLVEDSYKEAIDRYEKENKCPNTIDPHFVPMGLQLKIQKYRDANYENKKSILYKNVTKAIGQEFPCVFVSNSRRFKPHTQEIGKLVQFTEDSRKSSTLYQIHRQALKSHIDEGLRRACEAAGLIMTPRLFLFDESWGKLWDEFKASVPTFFELELEERTVFGSVSQLFGTITSRTRRKKLRELCALPSHSISDEFLAALQLSFHVGMWLPLFTIFGNLGEGIDAVSTFATFFTRREMLSRLALIIMVHERMARFGSPTITPEMEARAWITTLRWYPDIRNQVKGFFEFGSSKSSAEILFAVVNSFSPVDHDWHADSEFDLCS
ncbi:hypothetical protein TWF730_010257 [Orbilia blumenaviensis]|uniref:T6SS Phospholipase effector Tle1-like catalytic domain-containing protein n=1 Tax=Orbilia blumenaviensis TaxID=1796055 RepID=A0AAV9URG9_9PEZI